MSASQQVVIHFIGLVMWTASVTNDPGLHAILPRVHPSVVLDTSGHHETHRIAAFETIQKHTALLLFPQSAVVASQSTWKTQRIADPQFLQPALHGYHQVALAGEQLTFLPSAPNPVPAAMPTNIPKFSCPSQPPLVAGFQWPYSEAAAVVDVPEGELSVCEAQNVAPGRVDARLTLETGNTLTVIGSRSGSVKTLVLNTSAPLTIYVVNVPFARILDPTTFNEIGDKHYYAYWAMVGHDKTSNCSGPPTRQGSVGPCGGNPPVFFRRPKPGTKPSRTDRHIGTNSAETANSECSNTGWP
jgi:hypothetical protein